MKLFHLIKKCIASVTMIFAFCVFAQGSSPIEISIEEILWLSEKEIKKNPAFSEKTELGHIIVNVAIKKGWKIESASSENKLGKPPLK